MGNLISTSNYNSLTDSKPRTADSSTWRPQPGLTHFHPNVQALQGARESSAINNYMSKHGECIEWGTFQNDRRSSSSTKLQKVYAAAFASNDQEIALELIRQGDPRGFILNYNYSKINSKLDRIFKRPPEPYLSDFTDFSNVPVDLMDWACDNIREPAHRPLALF